MKDGESARLRAVDIAPVLAVLEQQLVELDRLEAWVAAAHLDASIQHLRLECYDTLAKPH